MDAPATVQPGPAARALPDEIVRMRLVERRGEMLSYFRRRLRSGADAEDAVQEASLKAIRGVRHLLSAESADAWLGQVMRSTLVDHYRRSAARARGEVAYMREAQIDAAAQVSGTAAAPGNCMDSALGRLRPEQAGLIRRVDLDERPRAEVANDLGITVNALGVRLHRARMALKGAILDICPTCARGEFAVCDCAWSGSRQPGLAAWNGRRV